MLLFISSSDMKEDPLTANATNEKDAKRLWLISERWTRLTKS
jgi:hypothetical protein